MPEFKIEGRDNGKNVVFFFETSERKFLTDEELAELKGQTPDAEKPEPKTKKGKPLSEIKKLAELDEA